MAVWTLIEHAPFFVSGGVGEKSVIVDAVVSGQPTTNTYRIGNVVIEAAPIETDPVFHIDRHRPLSGVFEQSTEHVHGGRPAVDVRVECLDNDGSIMIDRHVDLQTRVSLLCSTKPINRGRGNDFVYGWLVQRIVDNLSKPQLMQTIDE